MDAAYFIYLDIFNVQQNNFLKYIIRDGRIRKPLERARVSPLKLPPKGAKNRKATDRLIQLIGVQLKNKNVDGGMIPFGAKTMRQNNKKGARAERNGLPSPAGG